MQDRLPGSDPVAGCVEGGYRNIVHLEVVGMVVLAAGIGIGHHHLRPDPPDDRHQSTHRLVLVGIGEGIGAGVVLGVLHARVAVAQHNDLVVADDLRCAR